MEVQERVRIIDLAWEWVQKYQNPHDLPATTEARIKVIAQTFDQAYKAIVV